MASFLHFTLLLLIPNRLIALIANSPATKFLFDAISLPGAASIKHRTAKSRSQLWSPAYFFIKNISMKIKVYFLKTIILRQTFCFGR